MCWGGFRRVSLQTCGSTSLVAFRRVLRWPKAASQRESERVLYTVSLVCAGGVDSLDTQLHKASHTCTVYIRCGACVIARLSLCIAIYIHTLPTRQQQVYRGGGGELIRLAFYFYFLPLTLFTLRTPPRSSVVCVCVYVLSPRSWLFHNPLSLSLLPPPNKLTTISFLFTHTHGSIRAPQMKIRHPNLFSPINFIWRESARKGEYINDLYNVTYSSTFYLLQ